MVAAVTGFTLNRRNIHDQNAAERWKKFKLAWNSYSLATELNKKSEKVQVATLLTFIGEEARDVYSTFTDWADEGDQDKIAPVLRKFAEYCQPRKNVPFERYRFNRHGKECLKCGYQHPEKLESCPAIGQECRKCGKRNHFASRCTSKEVKATDL